MEEEVALCWVPAPGRPGCQGCEVGPPEGLVEVGPGPAVWQGVVAVPPLVVAEVVAEVVAQRVRPVVVEVGQGVAVVGCGS